MIESELYLIWLVVWNIVGMMIPSDFRIFQRGLKPPTSDNWMIKSELKCSYAKYSHDFLRFCWVCLTVESRIFTLHSMVNS